jgi:iron complex transport system substrate-binding protein
MRLKKYLISVLILICAFMLLIAGCGENDSKKEPESKTVTVTDTTGRSVGLPQPLEKVVVLNSGVAETMRILKVQDKVIGVAEDVHKYPYLGMQDKESVGKWNQPNYEKIVELKPQVVITYGSSSPGPELVEKLEPAGVKVVLLDFYVRETYDSDLKTLGKMFGKEKEANAFLKWKAEKIAILDKAKGLKTEQRVKVFSMRTSNFEKQKWATNGGGTGEHKAIEMAGGINVAQELTSYIDVSPEWILQQNPEILVFRGGSDEQLLGIETDDFGNVEKFKKEVANNKVLSKTDAVRNDRIYIISGRILGGSMFYLGDFYLAKWFYPDLFKDLDPDKILQEYFENWQHLSFKGKWAYPPVSKRKFPGFSFGLALLPANLHEVFTLRHGTILGNSHNWLLPKRRSAISQYLKGKAILG